jgi:hypothetical protein
VATETQPVVMMWLRRSPTPGPELRNLKKNLGRFAKLQGSIYEIADLIRVRRVQRTRMRREVCR